MSRWGNLTFNIGRYLDRSRLWISNNLAILFKMLLKHSQLSKTCTWFIKIRKSGLQHRTISWSELPMNFLTIWRGCSWYFLGKIWKSDLQHRTIFWWKSPMKFWLTGRCCLWFFVVKIRKSDLQHRTISWWESPMNFMNLEMLFAMLLNHTSCQLMKTCMQFIEISKSDRQHRIIC